MSHEEDATREIFGYTQHIPVPTWVDKNAYAACKHCQTKFSSLKEQTKQHHCRLCGEMFCGTCTGKYHVPLVYEQKGKKGPVRVCIGCKDSCLAQKEKEKNIQTAQQPQKHAVLSNKDLSGTATGSAAVRPSQFIGGPNPIEISPPQWDDAEKYVECSKCHRKGGKPHNCRACGHLYCDTCTTKMVLPPYFEKKKKDGPCRVCAECRFKILGGAKLVERSSTDLPELNGSNSSASSTTCVAPGCTAARVSKNGYCAAHVNEFGSGGSDLAASATLTVRWEGTTTVLTKVALIDKNMNLLQIDHVFKRQCPDFNKRDDFEYVYKGEGINEVFYDIFTAAVFAPSGNSIYIRKKVDTDLLVAQYARAGVATRRTAAIDGRQTMAATVSPLAAIDEHSASSHPPNNPFKRQDTPVAAVKKEVKVKEAPKPATVFHKPTAPLKTITLPPVTGAKQPPPPPSGAPGATKKPPPPPLPSSSSVASGQPAGPEVLKARAKLYFGAL